MFFAYNNGISATASDVKLNDDNTAIAKIKSWQIVNGGQTTAAISAVMSRKDIDEEQLASVFVAMKISVVKDKINFLKLFLKYLALLILNRLLKSRTLISMRNSWLNLKSNQGKFGC